MGRDELMVVVSAIHRLLQGSAESVPDLTPEERVEQIIRGMGAEQDGYFEIERYKEGAKLDPRMLQGLLLYDGLV